MNQQDELIERCQNMSFLLGIATGGIQNILNYEFMSDDVREALYRLLEKLIDGIGQLYYKDKMHK